MVATWNAPLIAGAIAVGLAAHDPELDRRLAPVLGLCILGIMGLGVACFWVAYRLSGEAW